MPRQASGKSMALLGSLYEIINNVWGILDAYKLRIFYNQYMYNLTAYYKYIYNLGRYDAISDIIYTSDLQLHMTVNFYIHVVCAQIK